MLDKAEGGFSFHTLYEEHRALVIVVVKQPAVMFYEEWLKGLGGIG